jgi:uncharacterized membrane protein
LHLHSAWLQDKLCCKSSKPTPVACLPPLLLLLLYSLLLPLAQASTSAASVVESMVRILRVLRVFRIFRLGKRLQNEIQMRLLTLIFTLLAIIVTSAGLFYEVSRRHTAGACVDLLACIQCC